MLLKICAWLLSIGCCLLYKRLPFAPLSTFILGLPPLKVQFGPCLPSSAVQPPPSSPAPTTFIAPRNWSSFCRPTQILEGLPLWHSPRSRWTLTSLSNADFSYKDLGRTRSKCQNITRLRSWFWSKFCARSTKKWWEIWCRSWLWRQFALGGSSAEVRSDLRRNIVVVSKYIQWAENLFPFC